MEPFSIRQLQQDDWEKFRDIRLESLSLYPKQYGCSFSFEKNYSEKDWREWLSSSEKYMIGFFIKNTLVGMMGVIKWSQDNFPIVQSAKWSKDLIESTGFCIALYLKKEYRQQGIKNISTIFYERVIDWLVFRSGYKQAIAAHRFSNDAPKRIYSKYGFKLIEETPYTWPDGVVEDISIYAKSLHV